MRILRSVIIITLPRQTNRALAGGCGGSSGLAAAAEARRDDRSGEAAGLGLPLAPHVTRMRFTPGSCPLTAAQT
jgi:hypothetical protein